jgi:hypothetical protein
MAVVVAMLWSFGPIPEMGPNWPWWLWGAIVVCFAVACAGSRMACTVLSAGCPKTRSGYSREWAFNHDTESPPALGIAMSGGGIRSAAFNIGILRGLHENGILRKIDIMSAVSGGSYAMSWFLLQPFYAAAAAARDNQEFRLDDFLVEMFRPEGRFQTYLARQPQVINWHDVALSAIVDATWNQPLRALWRPWKMLVPSTRPGSSGPPIEKGFRICFRAFLQAFPGTTGLQTSSSGGRRGSCISMSAIFRVSRRFTIVSSRNLPGAIACHISSSTRLCSFSVPIDA